MQVLPLSFTENFFDIEETSQAVINERRLHVTKKFIKLAEDKYACSEYQMCNKIYKHRESVYLHRRDCPFVQKNVSFS